MVLGFMKVKICPYKKIHSPGIIFSFSQGSTLKGKDLLSVRANSLFFKSGPMKEGLVSLFREALEDI